MRLAFIADGRAEHTRHWISYFARMGDEVLLLSTFPCPQVPQVEIRVLPSRFNLGSTLIKSGDSTTESNMAKVIKWVFRSGLSGVLYPLWQQARAVDVFSQARLAQRILQQFRPDVVHALRIQNEGYVAAWADYHPWILSSWGSDFVTMAANYPVHSLLTRQVVRKPDAFTADCWRDIRLAHAHGLPQHTPTRCFPGNGGIELDFFHPNHQDAMARDRVVLYARGMTPSVRIDKLFEAFKLVAERDENYRTRLVMLIPSAVAPIVDQIRCRSGLSEVQVTVLSSVGRAELAGLLRTAAVSVSNMPSDGVPVSMLEAMASGAFPVMSNLESIREWIIHRVNGMLFNPDDPEELAVCLQESLDNRQMRQWAQEMNTQLVRQRADYAIVMPQIREFYGQVIQ